MSYLYVRELSEFYFKRKQRVNVNNVRIRQYILL